MAKIKTVEDIKAEARRVLKEAKQKQKELLKEAAEIERRNVCDLGSKCIKFLENKIDIDTLKTFAINTNLIKISKEEDVKKEDNVIEEDETEETTSSINSDYRGV